MLDVVLKWDSDGKEQVIRDARAVNAEVNKGFGDAQLARQRRWSREQQAIARDQRRESFGRLSDAEKLNKLTERRLNLERFIAVAEQRGNTYRSQALRLRLAQTNGAIGALPQPGSSPGLLSGILGGAASRAFPFLGGLGGLGGGAAMGGPVGALIGVALVTGLGLAARRLTTGLSRAALASIQMADNLGDIADQFRITRDQVLRLQLGSGFAGVPNRVPMSGLATFENARSQALAGDPRFRGIFTQFGLGQGDLAGDQSSYELAQLVRKSLGTAGPRSSDTASLRALFGRRQEGVLASLKAAENAPVIASESDLRTLERVAGSEEVIKGIWEQLKMKATAVGARAGAAILVKYGDVKVSPGNAGPSSIARTALDTPPDLSPEAKAAQLAALPGRTAADSLSKIGLFVGGNNTLMRRMDAQISELRGIKAQLAALNREVASE